MPDSVSGVLVALRQIMRAVDLHSRKLQKNYNLTSPQLLVLKEISRSNEVSICSLAKAVNLSNATISGVVDRLEKRGYVVRSRGVDDRRKVLAKVTDTGREILGNNPPSLQEQFVEEFVKLNPKRQRQIVASLDEVALLMNAEALEVAPVLSGQPIAESANNHKQGMSK